MPPRNPLGFGASDFLEIGLAALLLFALAWRPWIEPYARRLARSTGWCMLALALLPVALRLLLLPHHPVPTPDIYDEFGHLLVADTLRHLRLANPAHPLDQFFETFFVLQEPAYSSIYPLGQGMVLALGWAIFGLPWAGVLLSTAALCSLCYWMLRGWTTPGWALAGGLLAVIQFGPLNLWTNCYWGGGVSAAAGCLVFGALPRLRKTPGIRAAIPLGAGLAIHLLTRPYESIFLLLCVVLYLLKFAQHSDTCSRPLPSRDRRERSGRYISRTSIVTALRTLIRPALAAALVVLPAIGLTLLQNKAVSGSWTTLPYVLSQYQYGVPAALTFQANPAPHRQLTPEQMLDYKMQLAFRGDHPETVESYLLRLQYRIRFFRFFFLPPLYLALPAFLLAIREYRFLWVLLCLISFSLGINFFPAFQFHYLAGVTCLYVLVSVTGLQQLARLSIRGRPAGLLAARVILFLCGAQFLLWYGLHLFDDDEWSLALRQYETWQTINHRNPAARIWVNNQLARLSGRQLVFVRYWPGHIFQNEWVYNAADIDSARVVWARDLGTAENEKLRRYYPDRTAWLLEPDARPPKLTPYPGR